MTDAQLIHYHKKYLRGVFELGEDKKSMQYKIKYDRWVLLRVAGQERGLWKWFITQPEEVQEALAYEGEL